MEQPDIIWDAFEGSLRQTTSFKSYTEQTLTNLHQQENESNVDLHTTLAVLLDKCNYNQCCMNTQKVQLFIPAVKYFAIKSWAREVPVDIDHDLLLDKAKAMIQLWLNTNITRTAGKTSWLYQQMSQYPSMLLLQ